MKFFDNTHNKEYIVAILLRHDEGQGFLLEVSEEGRHIAVTDHRAFRYSNGWENLTYDIDELLFYIENDHKIELKKAAFFVYSHLVDLSTREIATTYRESLDKLIKDNDLEALGYLEMDQVVSKYTEEKDQQPLSAVVVEIDTPAVSLFIYQAGELLFSESVARTENIIADLSEIFQHTAKDTIVPPRLIMYDAGGLQDEASKVIEHKWPKDIFLHVPKVEVFSEDDLQNSVITSYKEQILGATNPSSEPPPAPAASPEDLGFMIGVDVKEANLSQPAAIVQTPSSYEPQQSVQQSSYMSKIKNTIKMPRISFSLKFNRHIFLLICVVILFLGGLWASLYYAHSATLTIYYEKADIKDSVDFDNADFIEKKIEKIQTEATTKTTGTKKIGEKAKGSLTVFNATDAEKTFKKGTKIIASNKLVFLLGNDVTVKAATKTLTSGGDILTTTSKEKADVTAEDIGVSYNLGKDTKFTFENTSDTTYFAKSNDAFTGGTEKEIQTASKEDFTRIKSELEKEINKKKTASLKESADTHRILEALTEVHTLKEDFSKEIAEEAKTLDAEVTAEVTYYLYDDQKVRNALVKKLQDKVPEHYTLSANNITFTVKSTDKNDEKVSITLNITAAPVYKVDAPKFLSLIKGKSVASVEKIIKEKTDAQGFSIDVASPVPFLKFITPFFDKNYKITTEPVN